MDQSYYMLKKGEEIIYSGNNRAEMKKLIPKDDSYLYANTPTYNLLEVSINLEDRVVVRFSNNLHWEKDEWPRETGYFTSSGHGYYKFSPEEFDTLLAIIRQNILPSKTLSEKYIKELTEYFGRL
nr:hypothetical protein [Candidatus Woesearchaeota archaeon]